MKKYPEYSHAEVVARFADGKIAAARSYFGKGRVFIAGVTPEAPAWWSKEDGLNDVDGETNHELVESMIRWVVQ